MAALEASVKAAKNARSRHPAGGPEAVEARSRAKAGAQVGIALAVSVRSDERTTGQGRRPRAVASATSTRCCIRDGRASTQGGSHRVLRADRAGDDSAPHRSVHHVEALPRRRRQGWLLREALPEASARMARHGAGPGRSRRRHRVLPHGRACITGVGGQHGRARTARADGARGRSRRRRARWSSTSIRVRRRR